MWFPKPDSEAAVSLLNAEQSKFTSAELFRLLAAPEAEEWQHKVGVQSPAEGSAKATTRLLFSEGFVFKTDVAQAEADSGVLEKALRKQTDIARQSRIWHPDKVWFLLKHDDGWLPVSICPYLKNFRTANTLPQKRTAWTAMLTVALAVTEKTGHGLDINPSNFGWEADTERIYYVDDELYPATTTADLGNAMAARIVEEPDAPPDFWREWGQILRGRLAEFLSIEAIRGKVASGIRQYGLPVGLAELEEALITGLTEQVNTLPMTPVHFTSKVGIIADVHGNLQALKAVLKRAKDLNVDSWLFLGDAVGYGPNPRECIEILAELPRAIHIKGNHDAAVASTKPDPGANRLARLTQAWTIDCLSEAEFEWLDAMLDDYRENDWMAVHGAPIDPAYYYAYIYELTYADNLDYLEERGLPLCFYGHTHVPFVHRKHQVGGVQKIRGQNLDVYMPGTIYLINPGSVGQPRDRDPRASFAVWDRDSNHVSFHRVEYPIQTVIESMRKAGFAEDLHYRLEEGL